MKRTTWDEFNENEGLCKKVGCKDWNISVCCPELMTVLCNPKSNLLKRLKISEIDLHKNKITLEDIKDKMEVHKEMKKSAEVR